LTQDIENLASLVQDLAADKRALDILALEVGKVSTVADYFIIATGNTKPQVLAIADHILQTLKEEGHYLLHKEGYNEGSWVLLDYGSIVVHIFQPEERKFYNLERIWNHAPRTASIARPGVHDNFVSK
jgi:ribosome-associated protein